MFRFWVLIGRAALLASALALTTGASCAREAPASSGTRVDASELVIVSGDRQHRLRVEVVATDEARRQGMMFRTELADDAGMLFDFGPTPKPVSIWMKNTLIPLDIIFIAEGGRIARISPMATPQSLTSIPSGEDVISVLEVRGGLAAELGIKDGDKVRHPLFER
ncbi:MAG: DUF192 domain-containing protein [Parvularculaceae bacterium]